VPGVLRISAPLDREVINWYNLTVMVSDGISSSDTRAFNDTAIVYLSVLDTNEFNPLFIGGPTFQFHVTDGITIYHAFQVSTSVIFHVELMLLRCCFACIASTNGSL
jgi:hypothetical protein